jgi:hypothetical protein
VELQRKFTQFKLKVVPVLKTFDAGFFVRLALFTGVVYMFGSMAARSSDVMIAVKEDKSNSPNKFSKTLGQEQRLDRILENLREEEESTKQ